MVFRRTTGKKQNQSVNVETSPEMRVNQLTEDGAVDDIGVRNTHFHRMGFVGDRGDVDRNFLVGEDNIARFKQNRLQLTRDPPLSMQFAT